MAINSVGTAGGSTPDPRRPKPGSAEQKRAGKEKPKPKKTDVDTTRKQTRARVAGLGEQIDLDA